MFEKLDDFLIRVAIAALIILLGMVIAKLIKKFIIKLSKNVIDHGSLTFIGSCASISIKIIFIAIALAVLGLDMSVIVGSLSAVSLGISLALRDTMNDVAGGIQILFTKPFVIGDYVQIESQEGVVSRIEILFTVLQTFDHQEIIVPNSTAVSEILINYSKEKYRRIHISFPVALETDVDACIQLGDQVLESEAEWVQNDMQKEVVIDKIGDHSMTIGIYAFVTFEKYWECLCRMNTVLQRKRKEAGILPASTSIVIQSSPEQ